MNVVCTCRVMYYALLSYWHGEYSVRFCYWTIDSTHQKGRSFRQCGAAPSQERETLYHGITGTTEQIRANTPATEYVAHGSTYVRYLTWSLDLGANV